MRSFLRKVIGRLICRLRFLDGVKWHLLRQWSSNRQGHWFTRDLSSAVMTEWYHQEYLRLGPDQRVELGALLMGGAPWRQWAKEHRKPIETSSHVGSLPFPEACPLLPALDALLPTIITPLIVVQVGCASGRRIAWLAERHPQHAYVGTDVYPEVVAYAAQEYVLPSLTFEHYAKTQLFGQFLRQYQDRRIIVFVSGSLLCVQPEHLRGFWESMRGLPRLEVLVEEPVDEGLGNIEHLHGSRPRGLFCYTHNYRFYAEQAGWSTYRSEIIRPYVPPSAFPSYHQHTAHYFYWAKA